MDSVLLFGGSFNPLHNGHLIVSRFAAERLGIARVVLIPSASPPHKQHQELAPAKDRLVMCRHAVADDPQFDVDAWETQQSGPNYTLHTIRHFSDLLGDAVRIHWLIGSDSLLELHTWYHARELVDACTIVSVARPGSETPTRETLESFFSFAQTERLLAGILESPRIDIASTDIRRRVRAGLSIRHLVPEPVRSYIDARRLYRDA